MPSRRLARSRPSRARGLKRRYVLVTPLQSQSRPSRARGLKPEDNPYVIAAAVSRPSRARGLKQTVQSTNGSHAEVAPLAGAWIETLTTP